MLEAYIIRKIREEEERLREEKNAPRVQKPYYPPEPPSMERPLIVEEEPEENDGAIEIDI